jgi:chemotaxis protein MotA
MLIGIGYVVILAAVFGGYAAAGGHLGGLWQPLEVVMIFGGALGAFVVGNDMKSIKATVGILPKLFKGPHATKALYMDLLSLLFEILTKIRKDGLMSIENDIENPNESPLFSKYPKIVHDHHIVEFITDYLRLMVSGNMDAFQVENLMDNELDTHHAEGHVPANCLAKLGDGLPAFGIVAAVMGVVHTMESLHLPPNELGVLIGHALVGTFLGILLAYGFVGPLSGVAEAKLEEETKVLQTIKATLLASLNGYAPAIAVEFGRKVMFSTDRPGFSELEEYVKDAKNR